MRRYEIQPILDISRLPEFHYLPYEEAIKVIDMQNVPEFATIPDFFMPSKNIKYLLNNNPDELENNIEEVSNLVGVGVTEILEYINELHEKEKNKQERKKIQDSFNDSPLSNLNVTELKHLLYEHFKQKPHSSRKLKLDFLLACQREIDRRQRSKDSVAHLLNKLFC